MKYNKEELSKLAKGVFKDDKTSPSIYANEEGTFLNSDQYEERKKAGTHKSFVFEFKNPNVKPAPVADESAKEAEIAALKAEIGNLNLRIEDKDAKIESLTDDASTYESRIGNRDAEISRLNSDLGTAHAIISERDAELASLKAKLNGPPALAPEPSKKKTTKTAKA